MTSLIEETDEAISSASSIAQRIRALAHRPSALKVRDVIDDYMAHYSGHDTSRGQRLAAWQSMIGEFTLEQCDLE